MNHSDAWSYLTEARFEGAVFDLDGVIVDTARFHYLAWKELADRLGFEFTPEHNERLKGVSRVRSLEILLEVGGINADEPAFAQMLKEKNTRYQEYISTLKKQDILPGAESYILKLRDKGVRIALGSASRNAPFILGRLGLIELFDGISDGNSVSRAKPDPEVFIKASALIGVPPARCAVFEDSEAGIEAAKSAGMFSVGIGDSGILSRADIVVDGLGTLAAKTIMQRGGVYDIISKNEQSLSPRG